MKQSAQKFTLTMAMLLITTMVMAQDRPNDPNQRSQNGNRKGLGAGVNKNRGNQGARGDARTGRLGSNLNKGRGTQGGDNKRFGAPHGLRSEQKRAGSDRKTIRKPFNPEEHQSKKPQGGQQHGPKGGMQRVDKPNKPDLKKALELTEEQAKAMHEARGKLHKAAKGIHTNKELSKEQKHARLKEVFKKFDSTVQEILSPEQYTKLKHIRRQLAKPKREEGNKGPQHVKRPGGEQGKNKQVNSENGAQHHRRIAEALKLTDDQKKKLQSIHQHAVKRIRGIVSNKEIEKEAKKKLIGQAHKTAHNRRMEVLTAEQRTKLAGINAFLRAKNKPENGRPPQLTTYSPQPRPKPEKLVWSDEFNGNKLDYTKWGIEENAFGGGNHEMQIYTDRAKNVRVAGGRLIIEAHKDNAQIADTQRSYSSGRLRTKHRGDWLYGRIEVRAKLPAGQGLWPAIWMLPTENKYGTWASSGEIDIMEYKGQESDRIHGTLHHGGRWPDNVHTTKILKLPQTNFSEAFHTFAVEWEIGVIRWYLDGKLWQTQKKWSTPAAPFPAPFDEKFHLILNLAVGGKFVGSPNASTQFPARMEVDWIRVYQQAKQP